MSTIIERSVNPDKRRYINENEGPRHFIDLDAYGSDPFWKEGTLLAILHPVSIDSNFWWRKVLGGWMEGGKKISQKPPFK